MAKRNRASLLKRQREAEKRERRAKRAAKTALKRERRMQRKSGESQIAPGEDAQDNAASTDISAVATDVDHDASTPASGANGYGTSASEAGR
jgi:hypothetical protein